MTPEIMLSNGKYFNFMEPQDADYGIAEIAHALSKLCRFTGHCREFYSVAQHSVLVSYLVPKEYAMHGLLHDAAEAFINDMATPLKQLFPLYHTIEKRIEEDIQRRFQYTIAPREIIKAADWKALATERRDLLPNASSDAWTMLEGIEPAPDKIYVWSPFTAELKFINRFCDIAGS